MSGSAPAFLHRACLYGSDEQFLAMAPGAVVCDVRQARASSDSDPFLGLRPAELEPEPGDGLWLAGQICDWIEIRSTDESSVIRLQVAGRHNEEMAQPGIRYPI